MNPEQNDRVALTGQGGWRRVGACVLASAILCSVILGPLGPLSYLAGFLKSYLLLLLFVCAGFVAWVALFMVACIRGVRGLRSRRRTSAGFWLSAALGIVLAFALGITGRTLCPAGFGHGLINRLEMRTDFVAMQGWVESLDPADCVSAPHSGTKGRPLGREQQPEFLRHQDGMVSLELDAEGRPRVRLAWDESKAGMWGLVVGRKDMKTPPSEPGMYGEKRTQLRPGTYFWYEEG